MHLHKADDAELLRIAGRAGLILVTADDDFATLHAAGTIEHAGVLLIPEFRRRDAERIAAAVVSLLESGRPNARELLAWDPESGWTAFP
jgi:predicted nuclease of predicted toxin-antitoxin system